MEFFILIVLLLLAFGLGVLFATLLGDHKTNWPDGS